MIPEQFKYLDMVAKLSTRLGTRDVLYFDPKHSAESADIVVCTNPDMKYLDVVFSLTKRIALFFVKDDISGWIKGIEERFNILYIDPGFGFPVIFAERGESKIDSGLKQSEVAAFDMANRPATFDILQLCSTAKTFGAKHIRLTTGWFKKKNYSVEAARERLDSIIKPAIKLYGLDYSIGKPFGVTYSHLIDSTVRTYNHFGALNKIPCETKDNGYVTITLRKSRTPEKNSNEMEWAKFAKTLACEVIMVRDYDEQPISLEDRMKLYAGAHMNFFVNNGPALLCILSDAPYLCMNVIGREEKGLFSPEFHKALGIVPGFQYPWKNERQLLCYETDDCENIQTAYRSIENSSVNKLRLVV